MRYPRLAILAILLVACAGQIPGSGPIEIVIQPSASVSDTALPQPVSTQTHIQVLSSGLTPFESVTSPSPFETPEFTLFVPLVERINSTPIPLPQNVTFAVIGDYGSGEQPEADVAAMVASWAPDFVVTTGDNNYPDGAADTIDANIGQFYHAFIYPYTGAYGAGASVNRFFPSLGNHDWNTGSAEPYLDYFTLPGNERYYDFTWGPLHFFVLDSDSREQDGVGASSIQAGWLQEELAASTTPWQVVVAHHPPYSSGIHGPVDWMRWPFAEWGADVILSGHDHTFERIHRDGIVYFVNGLGGGAKYPFAIIDEGSQLRYNDDHGAMLVKADENFIRFQFINRAGEVIDTYELYKP